MIVGPTNALSLLVGAAVIATSDHDPVAVAIALAFGVALFQLVATALRLSTVVDYISSPTVLGYMTGAAVLIAIGQLHNITATGGPSGKLWVTLGGWLTALPTADPLAVAFVVPEPVGGGDVALATGAHGERHPVEPAHGHRDVPVDER